MFRFLAIIAILAGYVVMDVLAAAKLWLLIRPVRRLKSWRKRRKMASWLAEHGRPADEFSFLPPDEGFMSEAQQSVLRGLLKVAAGVLVTKGVIDVGEAGSLQVAIEALLAGLAGVVGFYLSHKKHSVA